jgi:hypothetical protein
MAWWENHEHWYSRYFSIWSVVYAFVDITIQNWESIGLAPKDDRCRYPIRWDSLSSKSLDRFTWNMKP